MDTAPRLVEDPQTHWRPPLRHPKPSFSPGRRVHAFSWDVLVMGATRRKMGRTDGQGGHPFQAKRSVSKYWSEKSHMDIEKDKDPGLLKQKERLLLT